MDYDTVEGIEQSLKSLDSFKEMLSARHTAGYDRGERMNTFVVKGTWLLDACGNCMKAAREFVPKEAIPDIDDVLTYDEFWDEMGKYDLKVKPNVLSREEREAKDFDWLNNKRPYPTRVGFGMGSDIPHKEAVCPVCEKKWSIEDMHDVASISNSENITLTESVGKTLKEVKDYYYNHDGKRMFMQSDLLIRNDKHIDLTPDPEFETLVLNKGGWMKERDGITDDYVIEDGDDGYFNVWTYYHKDCHKKFKNDREVNDFAKLFEDAGFKDFEMEAIPNGYCKDEDCTACASWFDVHFGKGLKYRGRIKIGWRKRVINIDWSGMAINFGRGVFDYRGDILKSFSKEDVTKGDYYIHAWGIEKATFYLKKMCEIINVGAIECQ